MIKKGQCFKCGHICCGDCKSLTAEGLCKIYEERPRGCRIYPHNPMALEKGCTIYFVENEKEITADNFQDFSEEDRRRWLEMEIE